MITLNNSNVASRFNPVSVEPYLTVFHHCRGNLKYDCDVRDKFQDQNIIAVFEIFIVQRIRDSQIYDYPK